MILSDDRIGSPRSAFPNGDRNSTTHRPINSLCSKFRNQLRGSCTPSRPETSCMGAGRKICSTHTHDTVRCSQGKIPNSWILLEDGKRRLEHTSNVQTFQDATSVTDFSPA